MLRLTPFLFALLLFLPSSTHAEPLRLVFLGDIMAHEPQLEGAFDPRTKNYDFTYQFDKINYLLKSDLLIGNFETVLGGDTKAYRGYPSFNTPDTLADALKKLGVDVLLLANNHTLDSGERGAERTWDVLNRKGFALSGFTPKKQLPGPLLMAVRGTMVGLINCSYGSNAPPTKNSGLALIDKQQIASDIAKLRKQGAEIILATFHWGIEYQLAPSKGQKDLAAFCLEQGVDAVIGTHPHVIQPVQIFTQDNKKACVAWSLANFVSGQRTLPRERSIALKLEFSRDSENIPQLSRVAVLPLWVELSRRPNGIHQTLVHPAQPCVTYDRVLNQIVRLANIPTGTQPVPPGPIKPTRLQQHLAKIHKEILGVLGIERPADPDGFHTLYTSVGD